MNGALRTNAGPFQINLEYLGTSWNQVGQDRPCLSSYSIVPNSLLFFLKKEGFGTGEYRHGLAHPNLDPKKIRREIWNEMEWPRGGDEPKLSLFVHRGPGSFLLGSSSARKIIAQPHEAYATPTS
jgi:hypothetical protein